MKITQVDAFVVEVPQKYPIAPYASRYRPQSSTKSVLVRIETDDGTVGWGETPQRYLGEQISGSSATAELRGKIIGKDPTAIGPIYNEWGLDGEHLQSAVEMACWDILGKVTRQPLYRLLGGAVRKEIELAACMGISPPERAREIARLYVEQGFTTLKTKAGRDPQEDLAMAKAIRDSVGDRLKLRMDPNTGYQPQVCLQLAKDLEPFNLEYFEQPMPEDCLAEYAVIRGQTTTPLALNESVTTLNAVREILDKEAAQFLLPDTYQCGGLWNCRLIADLAAAAGVPCIVHCSHDLGPKTAMMLHLAASTPNFGMANDCTYYGLVDDVLTEMIPIQRGRMRVPEGPGLGVQVSLAKVRKYEV
ncbi:MAG: mandelate racemase/muconate lactonizing enzyme family protein [Pirellulales bacterium]